MKRSLIAFTAAGIFFLAGCGDGSDTTTTTTDTATTSGNPTATEPGETHDTATTTSGDQDLMTSMQGMMSKMQSMQMTGDFDIDFANMMIEHHQSALDMAHVELSQGRDEKMKTKAQEIITKQQKEQQELRDFVQSYKASGMKHGEGELQKSMQTLMDNIKSMQMSGDVDKDFATMMISHHQDGVSMAKLELKNGMADKLKQMAKKGIADQQKDITELKSWLSSRN